jgi:hypothetical protein
MAKYQYRRNVKIGENETENGEKMKSTAAAASAAAYGSGNGVINSGARHAGMAAAMSAEMAASEGGMAPKSNGVSSASISQRVMAAMTKRRSGESGEMAWHESEWRRHGEMAYRNGVSASGAAAVMANGQWRKDGARKSSAKKLGVKAIEISGAIAKMAAASA